MPMRGSMRVEDIITPQPGFVVLTGMVIAGTLVPGMETIVDGAVLTIRALSQADGTSVQEAHRGETINLEPSGTSYDVIVALRGQVIEFSDNKTIPLKEQLALRPQLG